MIGVGSLWAALKKTVGCLQCSEMFFQSSFLKIPNFKKFLKNPYIEIPVLPAERRCGDRAPCVSGRLRMGCEACHTVLCQCKACASTKR